MSDEPKDSNPQEPDATPTGTPEPGTTPVADPQDGTSVTDSKPKDDGTAMRLKQENARYRKTLERLGVQPDSNQADLIAEGLIPPENVLPKPAMAPAAEPKTDTNAPTKTLHDRLAAIKARSDAKGKVTEAQYRQDMSDLVAINAELAQRNANLSEKEDKRTEADENQGKLDAVNAVMHSHPTFEKLSPAQQEAAQDWIVAAAHQNVLRLALEVGEGQANTQKGYAHGTRQAMAQFDVMMGTVGAQPDTGSKPSLDKATPPDTIRPGTGHTPSPPGKPKTIDDLEGDVAAYIAKSAAQV